MAYLEKWTSHWNAAGEKDFVVDGVYPALAKFFSALSDGSSNGSSILLPLCGSSTDLSWLAAKGLCVTGVECSLSALQAFAAKHGYELERRSSDNEAQVLVPWRAGPCSLYEGDWFAGRPENLGGGCFELAYDRAAIVAVEPEMRASYAAVLQSLLCSRARILLIALEFDESAVDPEVVRTGPHSLGLDEVARLFPEWTLQLLETNEVIEVSRFHRLRDAGCRSVKELIVLLDRGQTLLYITPGVPNTPPGVMEGWMDRFCAMTPEERHIYCWNRWGKQFGYSRILLMVGLLLGVSYFTGAERGFTYTEEWRVTMPNEASAINAVTALLRTWAKAQIGHRLDLPKPSDWDRTVVIATCSGIESKFGNRKLTHASIGAARKQIIDAPLQAEVPIPLSSAALISRQQTVVSFLGQYGVGAPHSKDWLVEWPSYKSSSLRVCGALLFPKSSDLCPHFNGRKGCPTKGKNCRNGKLHLCSRSYQSQVLLSEKRLCLMSCHGAARCPGLFT
eukprot:TRINITY_DN13612_c0_g1_i1.p1 TRINITY_DN13612_c0_g1~~TRINITY_DN13612_c0_g1_i1.p1  ORF type:complete len:506 (+),score=59.58 TRINITY_DN13612_c0_g1_i1:34-1551(+)